MGWIVGFILWWCVDDTLASTLGNNGLGELPWWVVALALMGLSATARFGIPDRLDSIEKALKGAKR